MLDRLLKTDSREVLQFLIEEVFEDKKARNTLIKEFPTAAYKELTFDFLKRMTRQDFGEDISKWKSWWQKTQKNQR